MNVSLEPNLEDECRKLMKTIRLQARRIWRRHGERVDLSDYEDAGYAALTACLARYNAHRGLLSTYAEHRIVGAMLDVTKDYWRTVHGKRRQEYARDQERAQSVPWYKDNDRRLDMERCIAQLPSRRARELAWCLLAGGTAREYAMECGIHETAISQWLIKWRKRKNKVRTTK